MVVRGKVTVYYYSARSEAYASNGYTRFAREEFEQLFGEAYDMNKHKHS
jgi:propanediol utilization protein